MLSRNRLALAVLLLAALRTPSANAQGIDLTELNLPADFLQLSDLVVYGEVRGGVTALATSTLMGSTAEVLLSMDKADGAQRKWLIAVQPAEWSLTDALPALDNPMLQGLQISGVTLVITNRDVTLNSWEMPDDEYWFYQAAFQRDEFTLTLKPGVNLFGTIPTGELPPDHALRTVMDALGIEEGGVFLQGSLGGDPAMLARPGTGGLSALKDLYLRAELPPMRPAGSPAWFRSGQLALELTGAPSVRVVGEINVFIDEEELEFFIAAALAKSGMSLAGGLNAEDGWESPFGIEWLVLNNITLALGIGPTGITPGFAAKMIIGEKDIDVAVSMTFTPAGVPSSMMFKGESEAGFGVSDLIKLQENMAAARDAAVKASGGSPPSGGAIPVDALPTIDFRNVGLQFAPKDAPELNVEKGMKIKGEMWLAASASAQPIKFASVDVGVTEDGMWAKGEVSGFTVGPLSMEDALLDLAMTREAQHLIMKGDVTLFGLRQAIDLAMTRESLSFRSQTEIFNIFTADLQVRSAFNLTRPDFQVDAVVSADFGDAVGPLFQQGMVAFVGAAADVVGVARNVTRVAEAALVIPEATVEQLRNALELQRQIAATAVQNATVKANQRRTEMNNAYAVRNRAWNYYYNLRAFPPGPKAAALVSYQAANATYLRTSVAYNASSAFLAAAQRIYAAIPPVNQNLALMRAEAAIAELRAALQTAQENLAQLERELNTIEAALARGEQLLVIERAEFHGGLQSAMNGEPIRWGIKGEFIGEPFDIQRTMDFSNVGQGAAQLVQSLIQK